MNSASCEAAITCSAMRPSEKRQTVHTCLHDSNALEEDSRALPPSRATARSTDVSTTASQAVLSVRH